MLPTTSKKKKWKLEKKRIEKLGKKKRITFKSEYKKKGYIKNSLNFQRGIHLKIPTSHSPTR